MIITAMNLCHLEDVLEACLSPEESLAFRRNCETFLGIGGGKGQSPSGLFYSRSSDGYFSPGLFPGSCANDTNRNGLESKEHLLQLVKSRTQQDLHEAYKPEMFCFYQTLFRECSNAPSHPLNSIPWRLMQLYRGKGRFFQMSTNAFVVNSVMGNPSQPKSKDNAVLNSPLLTGLCGKEGSGCECCRELLFSPDCWANSPHVSPYLRLERQLEIRAAHNSVMRCLDEKGVEEHLMSMMKMHDPHFRHVRVPMGRADNGTMVVALSVKVCIPTFRRLFRLSEKKDDTLYKQVNRMASVKLFEENRDHCVPHNPWHSYWSELPNLEEVHPDRYEKFRYTLKAPEHDTHLARCASAGVLPPQMTTRCLRCFLTRRFCKCPAHIVTPLPTVHGPPDAKVIENERKRACRVVVDAITLGSRLFKFWIDTAYIAVWTKSVMCAKNGRVVVRKLVNGKMYEEEEEACQAHIVQWLCLCPGLLLCQSPEMENFRRPAANPTSIAVEGIRRYINPGDDCSQETHFTMNTWLCKRVQAAVTFIELEREGGTWEKWNNVDDGLFSAFYDRIPTMGLLGAFKSAFGHKPTLDRRQWSQGNGVDDVDEERAVMVIFGHQVPLETKHLNDVSSLQWRKAGSAMFFPELHRVEGILSPLDHPELAQIMTTMEQKHDCRPWTSMCGDGVQRWARVSKIRAPLRSWSSLDTGTKNWAPVSKDNVPSGRGLGGELTTLQSDAESVASSCPESSSNEASDASSGGEKSSDEECAASSGSSFGGERSSKNESHEETLCQSIRRRMANSETSNKDSASSETECEGDHGLEDPDLPRHVWCDGNMCSGSDTISALGSGRSTKKWKWEDAMVEEQVSSVSTESIKSDERDIKLAFVERKIAPKRQRRGSGSSSTFKVAFLDGYEVDLGCGMNDIKPRHLF